MQFLRFKKSRIDITKLLPYIEYNYKKRMMYVVPTNATISSEIYNNGVIVRDSKKNRRNRRSKGQ